MELFRLLGLLIMARFVAAIPGPSELNRRQIRVVEDAMNDVIDSLKQFDSAIIVLSTDPSTQGPVLRAADDIQTTIAVSTRNVQNGRRVNFLTVAPLLRLSNNMVEQVRLATRDLQDKKPIMDQLGVNKVALDILRNLKPASMELADAIGDKVPDLGRDRVERVKSDIVNAMDAAIRTYNQPVAGSPPPPPAPAPVPDPVPVPGPVPASSPPTVVTVTTLVPAPAVVTVTAVGPPQPAVVTVTAVVPAAAPSPAS